MFTQCTDCGTVYEISAANLTAARGLVRCGECGATFNALSNLSERPPSAARPTTRGDDDGTVPELGGDLDTAATLPGDEALDTAARDALERSPMDADTDAASTRREGADRGAPASAATTAGAGTVADGDELAAEIEDAVGALPPDPDDTDEVLIEEPARPSAEPPDSGDTDEVLVEEPAREGPEQPDPDDTDELLFEEPARRSAEPRLSPDDDSENPADTQAPAQADDPGGRTAAGARTSEETAAGTQGDEAPPSDEARGGPTAAGAAAAQDRCGPGDGGDVAAPATSHGEQAAATRRPGRRPGEASPALPTMRPLDHAPREFPEWREGGLGAATAKAAGDARPAGRTAPDAGAPASPAATIDAGDAVDAADAQDLHHYLRPRERRSRVVAWSIASVLLLLVLLAQAVHHFRGQLATHPRLGPWLQQAYSLFDLELHPQWNVDRYRVVGQARLFELPPERAGEPQTLRFVVVIANGPDRPRPHPSLRLVLRDRWGDAAGLRDFDVDDYLALDSNDDRMLAPDERVRVVINMIDPGTEVTGFDFDMCLRDGDGELRCADG